jgi:hypothetical protein
MMTILRIAAIAATALTLSTVVAGPAGADPAGAVLVATDNISGIGYTVGIGPDRLYLTGESGAPGATNLYADTAVKTGPGTVGVTNHHFVEYLYGDNHVSVSSGRALFGYAELRSDGASTSRFIAAHYGRGVRLSGNRALYFERSSNAAGAVEWPVLYSIRNGARWAPFGSGHTVRPPMDLWGEYFVYAYNDGSVYRRDLRTGTTLKVRAAGSRVAAVAVSAHGVAWLTACPTSAACAQTLAWRPGGTGTVRSIGTTRTTKVRMTGGYLAVNVGTSLRTVDLSTRAVTVISTLTSTPEFDAHDELITWIKSDRYARVAPMPAYPESPRYLGNAIGFASFSPNGDGVNDVWRAAFPISKALPTCRVTFRKNGTAVRIIGCATTTGLAQVLWDGRTGSGNLVSKGTYTWTITGNDTDGALRWYNGSAAAITGTVQVT